LTQYIDLISKYQDKEQWKVVNEKFVCTTMKDEIQKYNKLVLDKFTTNELNTIVLDKKTAELPNNKKEFHHNKSQSQSQSQEKAISSLLENNLKLTTAIEYLIEDNRKHEKEIALLKKKVEELKK
jgi:GTPase involved in cell partitioning and DNA repair